MLRLRQEETGRKLIRRFDMYLKQYRIVRSKWGGESCEVQGRFWYFPVWTTLVEFTENSFRRSPVEDAKDWVEYKVNPEIIKEYL